MASHGPLQPVPLQHVHIDDPFWSPRLRTCLERTIPHVLRQCEATGRIANFARAAGRLGGPHQGIFYDDSDVFKAIEGAAYALQLAPDPALEAYLDDLIEQIAAAQEPDGYLYTARTIDPAKAPEGAGPERWSNLRVSHELYNAGHLYEAAIAVHQASGKRTLLEVALRNADLVAAEFGQEGRRDVPGHQEIELGLMRLYGHTGERKYLDLARFFIDERGRAHGRELYGEYAQDHLPVREQNEAVGHAVRAGYLYAALAEAAGLTGDQGYADVGERLWEDVTGNKLALTGGMGARRGNEGFGLGYELPTRTAYNESCAAVANILWNQRLFLRSGDSKYIDILERALYNGFLAGLGMDGETFFYYNPLATDGRSPFNPDVPLARQAWYRTACCPTNVARLLPQLGGLIYAAGEGELCVNLYADGGAEIEVGGAQVRIEQESGLPWEGQVRLDVRIANVTAGIHGTDVWCKAAADRDIVCLIDGEVSVERTGDDAITLSEPLTFYVAPKGRAAFPVRPVDPEQLRRWARETDIEVNAPASSVDGAWTVYLESASSREAAERSRARLEALEFPVAVRAAEVGART